MSAQTMAITISSALFIRLSIGALAVLGCIVSCSSRQESITIKETSSLYTITHNAVLHRFDDTYPAEWPIELKLPPRTFLSNANGNIEAATQAEGSSSEFRFDLSITGAAFMSQKDLLAFIATELRQKGAEVQTTHDDTSGVDYLSANLTDGDTVAAVSCQIGWSTGTRGLVGYSVRIVGVPRSN